MVKFKDNGAWAQSFQKRIFLFALCFVLQIGRHRHPLERSTLSRCNPPPWLANSCLQSLFKCLTTLFKALNQNVLARSVVSLVRAFHKATCIRSPGQPLYAWRRTVPWTALESMVGVLYPGKPLYAWPAYCTLDSPCVHGQRNLPWIPWKALVCMAGVIYPGPYKKASGNLNTWKG
jgi:hypothetical protein